MSQMLGKPFRKRTKPLALPKAIYLHVMDNTEGIPGNRPIYQFSFSKANPFGRPGVDYSEEYPWSWHLYTPEQAK